MVSSSVTSWVLAGFVAAIGACAVLFAATATYARSELVPGMVLSVAPLAKVVVPRPGLVTWLLVEEGQHITAGQPLALLPVEQASLSGAGAATTSLASIAEQCELANDRIGLEQQRAGSEQVRLAAQIAWLGAQLNEVDRQIALQDELVTSARTAEDQAETLIRSGFATRSDLERRRQGWLQAAQGRRQLAQSRDALSGQQATARAELARLPVDAAAAVAQIKSGIA